MRVVRYTAMPPASAMGSATPRFVRRTLVLLLAAGLLAAAGLTFSRLRDIDPRARGGWAASPVVFDQAPRDLTVFVPACDVRSFALHPAPGSAGWLSVEFLRRDWGPRGQVQTTHVGGATLRVAGAAPVTVPLDAAAPAWREALTLQVRVVDSVGQSAPGLAPIPLDPARPVALDVFDDGWLGRFACAFDGGRRARAWTVVAATLLVMAGAAWLGAAWIARALSGGAPARVGYRTTLWVPLALTLATTAVYALVVPPFEPPDELAHFQYARYVAATGALPDAVPPHDSEWRASSYEWVQQPLYYIAAAAALKAADLDAARPALALNPRSRMQAGGTEPTIFRHAAPPAPAAPHQGLGLLRFMSLLMAVGTAIAIARLVALVTDEGLIVATVAGGLGLVPQWCAVMGAVSTDPPATFLAALATLAVVRIGLGRVHAGWLLLTGVSIGAAYAVKTTAVFLVPMALLACAIAARGVRSRHPERERREPTRVLRETVRLTSIVGAGTLFASAWIHVRAWLVFGDPQAFAFKKAVLEAGGFVPARGPMPWHAEFWVQMRVMVFEPFWARFGSLGAGPFPDSRVWIVYGGASLVLLCMAFIGVAGAWAAVRRGSRAGTGSEAAVIRAVPVWLCAAGVSIGLAAWIGVNLFPRADMVVHWTPRHILPLTAPAAVLVAAGLAHLVSASSRVGRVGAAVVGLVLPALALAWLGVFRATVLMFHFGY